MEQALPLHHTDWLLWLSLGVFSLLLAARLYNPIRFKAFSILPFHANRSELEASFRPVVGRGLFDVSLGVSSFATLGLALFLILHPNRGELPVMGDWRMYLRLTIVLLLFFVFKNFMGLLVGWVFNKTDFIAKAQNVSFAYRAWLGVLLFPVCVAMVYSGEAYQWLYYVLLVGLCVGYYFSVQFFTIRIWRIDAFVYYKIFYLCALEITPLIFLVSWLQSLYR